MHNYFVIICFRATAYIAMREIGNAQPGETVFVNGAAGAVGHIVGQISKIKVAFAITLSVKFFSKQ